MYGSESWTLKETHTRIRDVGMKQSSQNENYHGVSAM